VSAGRRVLGIALDAAEPSLVEQWMEEGVLPNLRRLRERGAAGRLSSSARWLAGSPWPTFYTGTPPSEHGLYHFMQWRPDQMTFARPTTDWCDTRPFWRELAEHGKRVVSLDMPMTHQPVPFDGVEISGWATHDRLAPPASHPAPVLEEIRRDFGEPPVEEEEYGPQPIGKLLELRDDLLRATSLVTNLAGSLIARERWDLFLVGYGATHRGGHKLWGESSLRGEASAEQREELARALRQVYAASDAAVGELVRAAGDDVSVFVFSLHGMGANTNRSELLPQMLERVLAGDRTSDGGPEGGSRLQRLRRLVPLEWRHAVKSRLPKVLQDRLTLFWRAGHVDWSTTPAFCLEADLQGYVRVNRRGREAAGIVAAGEQTEALLQKIEEGLLTFVDADTGAPIVEELVRGDDLGATGARRDHLPDLVVRWVDRPVTEHRALESPRFGAVDWPTPGGIPDGRSGNHRPEGFVIAAGDSLAPGSTIEGADILDLVPMILSRLGVPAPAARNGLAPSPAT